MMDLSLIKMALNWKSPSWMEMWWSSVGFNPFAHHPPKSSLSQNWDYVKSYVMQSLQRGTESVQLLVEFHLERQRVVSSHICTFVLVYAIRQLPAQMRRARAFTHFLSVYESADEISVRENTAREAQRKQNSRAKRRGPRSCSQSQVSQMNESIKKEAFVPRFHQSSQPGSSEPTLWTGIV